MRVTTTLDEQIGARLRQLRITRKMTQGDLARELKLSYQQVQKYEVGVNRISAVSLNRICKIYVISVEYFYNGLDDTKPLVASPFINQPADRCIRVAEALNSMPEGPVKQSIFELVEACNHQNRALTSKSA